MEYKSYHEMLSRLYDECTDSSGSARPAKDSLDGEDRFLRASEERATSATTTLAGTNLNREILDELEERLGNFHDGARALASGLQTRDVTRKTDQSMIAAAKCMFHKLLGEASENLERVTPQSRDSIRTETARSKHRCSPPEAPGEKSVQQTPTDGPIPPSPSDRSGLHPEKLESVSETQSSRESLEQVIGASVQTWRVDIRIQNVVVHYDDIEFALHRGGEDGHDSRISDVHWTWIRRLECRQVVS